jgi:CubicO group peptidase (beta-lactamase class C family)
MLHVPRRVKGLLAFLSAAALLTAPAPRQGRAARRPYWPTREWRTASPQQAGLSPQLPARLDRHVRTALPHVRSVLVVRHGFIVYERYYQGTDRETLHPLASVTKSVTSMLVGVALRQRVLTSLDRPIGALLPECREGAVARVTLRQLLAMQSGFVHPNEPSDLDVRDACARGLASPPGRDFAYDTPASHVVLAAVAAAAKTDAVGYATRNLFQPLGVGPIRWRTDPEGRPYGGSGLSLRTRDLARLGYLYLNEGRWDQRQVVPAAWVRESTRAHSGGGAPENEPYGYFWWVPRGGGRDFYADGFGGQIVYVLPDRDLVVVITSNADAPHAENRSIVAAYVVPAITRAGP